MKSILGLDAHPNVVALASALPAEAWTELERLPKYEILTEPRTKPDRVKEAIVREKGYENIVRVGEDVAEIEYRPAAYQENHRLVILRKNLSVQRGERVLFEDVRYLFYPTTPTDGKVARGPSPGTTAYMSGAVPSLHRRAADFHHPSGERFSRRWCFPRRRRHRRLRAQ